MTDLVPDLDEWIAIRPFVHDLATAKLDTSLDELRNAETTFVKYVTRVSGRLNQKSLGQLEKQSQNALTIVNASKDDLAWSRYRAAHPNGRGSYDRAIIRKAMKEHRQ